MSKVDKSKLACNKPKRTPKPKHTPKHTPTPKSNLKSNITPKCFSKPITNFCENFR